MARDKKTWLPWVALFIIYVVWGSTYTAIRYVVVELPPRLPAGLRFLAAGLVMTALALWRDRGGPRPTSKQLWQYALVGAILLGFSNGMVMWAEVYIPSGIAALIVATVPLWTTLFEGMRRGGEPWTARLWLGGVLGLAGVGFVARPEGDLTRDALWAAAALTVASIAWTLGALYSQTIDRKLPVFSAAAIEMIAGGIVQLVLSLAFREDWSRLRTASASAWLALGYLAVFGSIIAFTAFAYCLNNLPATTVGTYAYVNPIVAVLLGRLLLDEPLTERLIIGGILILAAVLLTTLKRRPTVPPPAAACEEPAS